MIRQASAGELDTLLPHTEAALKICGLYQAYGADKRFCRFWKWGQGGCLASLDGAAVLYANEEKGWEELSVFLQMSPDIRSLRTDEEAARQLSERLDLPAVYGAVMQPAGRIYPAADGPEVKSVPPRELYPLLSLCFPGELPPFESWYADISHRFRHGCCRIAAVWEDGQLAACCMTTAEGGGGALIGAVATHPDKRGRGYASACVTSMADCLQKQNRTVYLSPKNEPAHRLYQRLGFVDTGRWGSLVLPNGG